MSEPSMPMPPDAGGDASYPVPPFDASKPHHAQPKLRQVRAFSAKQGEHVFLGLADSRQITQRVVLAHPAFQLVLPMLDGVHGLDQVVKDVGKGLTRELLERVVAQLDAAGLLEGPTFDDIYQEFKDDFDKAPSLPPSFTADFADALVAAKHGGEATDEQKRLEGADALRAQFDAWIDEALREADDPSYDEPPRAIVAPHIDYGRGWLNYAQAWGRMRVVDQPDRVVVLGTNHYGSATGVCACDKGYTTPLGECPFDEAFAKAVAESLGPDDAARLYANKYDHEREHSIELQTPWLQHVLGTNDKGAYPSIFAALVHDPSVNAGESYDGKGVGLLPFVDALRSAMETLGGRTLIVCSADLSHVGPMFGDEEPVVGEQADKPESVRNKAIQHDREMLQLFVQAKAEEMVSTMAWMQNPTRWCSTGAMVATLKALDEPTVRIANYGGAVDQQGSCMVTSCAAAVF